MSWTHPYIGLPWVPMGRHRTGVDCYGLVRLVYGEVGITLPTLTADPACAAETAAAVQAAASGGDWVLIDPAEARPMDLVIFRNADHVGLWVDRRHMLHIATDGLSGITRHDLPPWRPRLVGIARHRGLA